MRILMTDGLHMLDALEMKDLIKRTRLNPRDRKIAEMALVDVTHYADIGAEVGYTRSAIGYRLRRVIIPALEKTHSKTHTPGG